MYILKRFWSLDYVNVLGCFSITISPLVSKVYAISRSDETILRYSEACLKLCYLLIELF